jgi:hypothetical protein
MNISVDLFEAFIKCSTKCWLRASGEPTSGNAYADALQMSLLSTEMRIREKRSLTRCLLSPLPAN